MACTEFLKIQNLAESAREQLRGRASTIGDQLVPSDGERAARTALFSAEIDAAFHKSRCAECGGSSARPDVINTDGGYLSSAA